MRLTVMTLIRRGTVLMVLSLAFASLGPAQASSTRTVRGEIAFSSPSEQASRCAWLLAGNESQGLVGYVIPLQYEEGQGGYSFRLRSTSPAASLLPVALNYQMLSDLGSCTNYRGYNGTRIVNKAGVIPAGMRFMIITVPWPHGNVHHGLCFYYWVPFVFPCGLPSAERYGTTPVRAGFEVEIFSTNSS